MHQLFELHFASGIKDIIKSELAEWLPPKSRIFKDDGKDTLKIKLKDKIDFSQLKTINSVYYLFTCNGQRPSTILGDVSWQKITQQIKIVKEEYSLESSKLSMPGRDTKLAKRIKDLLEKDTGLIEQDDSQGSVAVIIRKSLYAEDSWDVLIRTTPFPLSKRCWRVANYPGAVSASLAASIVRLSNPSRQDKFLNLMSGSATFLIERATFDKCQRVIGVDFLEEAISAARLNLARAEKDILQEVELLKADIGELESSNKLVAKFNKIVADPPWGERIASKLDLKELYLKLFDVAFQYAEPQANFLLLTQEVKLVESIIPIIASKWTLSSERKVYQGGYHPVIYSFTNE